MYNISKIILIAIFFQVQLFPHCQIPCGIYSDNEKILQIYEDLKTIEKAMDKIIDLSNNNDPQSLNQISRWTIAKESHAQNIQTIASEYFLTQRIKESSEDYVDKVTILHKLLISTMKCKQSVDQKHVVKSKTLLDTFSEIYLDDHSYEHLKSSTK
tara:strand:+ start:415 stop:882 length:468 start_codon:yes stop_codon:yes gene_type:complete